MIRVAETVSSLPGAVVPVAAMPDWGLIAVTAGGLWLCLWRRPWRLYGLLAIALGLAGIWLAPRPDILIDGQAKRIAVRAEDGGLLVSAGRGDRMAVETWLARNGGGTARAWPASGESAPAGGCAAMSRAAPIGRGIWWRIFRPARPLRPPTAAPPIWW